MKILVGTYRVENREWIERRHLYNLPVCEKSQIDGLNQFDAIVLFGQDDEPIAYSASCVGSADQKTLANSGYHVSENPHSDLYALFMLQQPLNVDDVLSDPTADVCVCSSRYTGRIDAAFYSRSIPYCGGKSMPFAVCGFDVFSLHD